MCLPAYTSQSISRAKIPGKCLHAEQFACAMQGRLRFRNPFRSSPGAPEPQSTPINPQDPLRGSVPLADYRQSTLLGGSGSLPSRGSGLTPPTAMQHANGSASHARSACQSAPVDDVHAAGSLAHPTSPSASGSVERMSDAARSADQDSGSRSALRSFFSWRQQPNHAPGPLPEQPSDSGHRRKQVRFSPEKGSAGTDPSTTPDRFSLHGRERRSDVGDRARQTA